MYGNYIDAKQNDGILNIFIFLSKRAKLLPRLQCKHCDHCICRSEKYDSLKY